MSAAEGQVTKHLGFLLLGPGLTPFGEGSISHLVTRAVGEQAAEWDGDDP